MMGRHDRAVVVVIGVAGMEGGVVVVVVVVVVVSDGRSLNGSVSCWK